MFETGLTMEMISRHRLAGGPPGERDEHSHHYRVEVTVRGDELDAHGYLVDIDVLREALASTLRRYRDKCLNDLEDFQGIIPSLENLARVIWSRMSESMDAPQVRSMAVRVWESEVAWASYERGRSR